MYTALETIRFPLDCVRQMAEIKKISFFLLMHHIRKECLDYHLVDTTYLHPLIQLYTASLNSSRIGAIYERGVFAAF